MASTASAKLERSKEHETAQASSLPGLCLAAALKHGKQDALNHKVGSEWISILAETFVERVRNVALGLAELGIKPGDRIALLSENRPDWSIAIPGRDHHWTIPLRNGAIATSTVTRRNWRQGETARHHLIDPATGEPARSDILSATVVAPYCRQAEVGAKVALLLGAQAGVRFLETRGLAGLLVPMAGDYLTAGPWPRDAMMEIARETR